MLGQVLTAGRLRMVANIIVDPTNIHMYVSLCIIMCVYLQVDLWLFFSLLLDGGVSLMPVQREQNLFMQLSTYVEFSPLYPYSCMLLS